MLRREQNKIAGDTMNMIRPVSDLRNDFAESKTVHETAQPVK